MVHVDSTRGNLVVVATQGPWPRLGKDWIMSVPDVCHLSANFWSFVTYPVFFNLLQGAQYSPHPDPGCPNYLPAGPRGPKEPSASNPGPRNKSCPPPSEGLRDGREGGKICQKHRGVLGSFYRTLPNPGHGCVVD